MVTAGRTGHCLPAKTPLAGLRVLQEPYWHRQDERLEARLGGFHETHDAPHLLYRISMFLREYHGELYRLEPADQMYQGQGWWRPRVCPVRNWIEYTDLWEDESLVPLPSGEKLLHPRHPLHYFRNRRGQTSQHR